MHTQTWLTHTHPNTQRTPAESIDGHTHGHRHKQTDTQAQTHSFVLFLNNLSSYGSCREVRRIAEKMFRHLSLTTSAPKKHCYATVGHFVNCRDDSVALKCQNKWRNREEKDKPEQGADVGSELL